MGNSCPTCRDRGWAWLRAVESSGGGSRPLVRRIVRFRAPCTCPDGARWAADHAARLPLPTDSAHRP